MRSHQPSPLPCHTTVVGFALRCFFLFSEGRKQVGHSLCVCNSPKSQDTELTVAGWYSVSCMYIRIRDKCSRTKWSSRSQLQLLITFIR